MMLGLDAGAVLQQVFAAASLQQMVVIGLVTVVGAVG